MQSQTTRKWLGSDENAVKRAAVRLYCFPYAGGGASLFKSWQQQVTSRIAVCPVRLPGREARLREPRITELEIMMRELFNALAPQLTCPYALFGHSMGGILAYELAAMARIAGLPEPVHLFVSARPAPKLDRRMINVPVSTLNDEEFLLHLRRIEPPSESLDNPELREMLLPLLRSDFELCESYRNRQHASFSFPITGFFGSNDTSVTREDMEPWRECTSGTFRIVPINGGHFFMCNSAHTMLREIERDLRSLTNDCKFNRVQLIQNAMLERET